MTYISIHGIRSLTVDVSETRREDGTAYRCLTFVSQNADGTMDRVRFFTESLELDLDGLSLECEIVNH